MKAKPEVKDSKRRFYYVFFNSHSVSGIIITIGLYVIFLTGAFALFEREIIGWEINAPHKTISPNLDYDKILSQIETEGYQMYGRNFTFNLSHHHGTYLSVFSNPPADRLSKDSLKTLSKADSLKYAKSTGRIHYAIDTDTYQLTKQESRNPARHRIGRFITRMHYFHQIPSIGLYLSGFVALFFSFAIISGVIIHWKKIISNFFTFRLKNTLKNLWTDAHTALGVLGIPFQFMYGVTGTFFGFKIILLPIVMFVFEDFNKAIEILAPFRKTYELQGKTTDQMAITPLVNEAFSDVPVEDIDYWRIFVKSYGDKNSHLDIVIQVNTDQDFTGRQTATYHLADGRLIAKESFSESAYRTASFQYFRKLHYGNFGGYLTKIVYFILAILTCVVIISGVMVWLLGRDKKSYASKKRFNANLGAVYLGSCLGLYPSLAFMFILAKTFPMEMPDRLTYIGWIFLAFWIAYTVYAFIIKNQFSINRHALILGGLLGLLIPIFNGFHSSLWVWRSYAMGYPYSFSVDMFWLICGSITLVIGLWLKPEPKPQKSVETRQTKVLTKEIKPMVKEYFFSS